MPEDDEIKAMAAIKAALDPLDEETRAHVLRWAANRFGVEIDASLTAGDSEDAGADQPLGRVPHRDDPGPLSVFRKGHPTKTQAEDVAVLATWDHLKNGTEEFTGESIEALWKKGGLKKAGNLNAVVGRAATNGWLDKKSHGKYEITQYGVQHVLTELVPIDKTG